MRLYVDRFNDRDWDGLRDLISADARLQVADRYAGRLVDSPYFSRYEARPHPWRAAVGIVDGLPAVIILVRGADSWTAGSIVHLDEADDRFIRVRDYTHCPWMIPAAISFDVSPAAGDA